MATMQDIENLAQTMAAARDALTGTWMAQEEEIAAVKKKHLKLIRTLTAKFKAAGEQLGAAVRASPDLFAKPRTVILHGIKAGFQKGKGGLDWDDEERVVALIKRHFKEQADILIKTTEKPVKGALAELTVDELKKLGITVEDTGDVVVVRLADSDTAKMIKALLKGAPEEDES